MSIPSRVHPSKIDAWLFGLLIGSAAFGLMCAESAAKSEPEHRPAIYGTYLLTLLAVSVLSVPTRYTITESELLVRSGLMRWRIRLTDIQEVFPTRNPMSSPAWSLDRLHIRYKRGGLEQSLCISPASQDSFLTDLSTADPNLVFDDGQIKRREFGG